VLANRLSQNPSHEVLLLERGGDPNPLTDIPSLMVSNLPQTFQLPSQKAIASVYQTTTQTEACGQQQGVDLRNEAKNMVL